MSILLLMLADIALGGIAWRLGKKNEVSNQNMERAIGEMGKAVVEMKKMNDNLIGRMDRLEDRMNGVSL